MNQPTVNGAFSGPGAKPARMPWRIAGKLDLVPVACVIGAWLCVCLRTAGRGTLVAFMMGAPALSSLWLALRAWQTFPSLLDRPWREQLALTSMDARQFWRSAVLPMLLVWTLPWILAHPLPTLWVLRNDRLGFRDFCLLSILAGCIPGIGWLVVLHGVLGTFARLAAGSRSAGTFLVAWTVAGLATPWLILLLAWATGLGQDAACFVLAAAFIAAAIAVWFRGRSCWRSVFDFEQGAAHQAGQFSSTPQSANREF